MVVLHRQPRRRRRPPLRLPAHVLPTGLSPGPPPEGLGLASNQVYFAHFAITDVAAGRHAAAERFSRGAGGLAGATGEPFAVWLEDWRADSLNADGSAVRLVARDAATVPVARPRAARDEAPRRPRRPRPLAEERRARQRVVLRRLHADGRAGTSRHVGRHRRLRRPPEVEVSGEAWFDHEWSTSALGAGAVGWDWFSLQLDDGRELMHFQIRREDGSIEPVSGGTLVETDGRTRRLSRDDVRIEVLRRWTSPETGGTYPSRWRLAVPSEGLDLLVEPWLEAQEMRTSFVYWEGAVRVSDAAPRSQTSLAARPARLREGSGLRRADRLRRLDAGRLLYSARTLDAAGSWIAGWRAEYRRDGATRVQDEPRRIGEHIQ